MPRNSQASNSAAPPAVMTWRKAMPVLILGGIFDALRFMFEMFWFFAPAIAAALCTIAVHSDNQIASVLGLIGCTSGATAIGAVAAAPLELFGVIMAEVTGLAGWLIIGIILLSTNSRIFKENFLWFAGSLLLSEIPIVGSVPAITLVLWRMYANQIKQEKAALRRYEAERAEEERRQQALIAAQAAQAAQAANDEAYGEEIPEDAEEAA